MKTQGSILQRYARPALVLVSVAVLCGEVSVLASPPKKIRPPSPPEALEKVGNFFFNLARKLEEKGAPNRIIVEDGDVDIIYDSRRDDPRRYPREPGLNSTGLNIPPEYRGIYIDPSSPPPPGATARIVRPPGYGPSGERFAPPTFQANPQPKLHYPGSAESNPRSSLNVPADPADGAAPSPVDPRDRAPFDAPATPPAKSKKESAESPKQAAKPEPARPAAELSFATPVPGHRGFVYPPGVKNDPKNMLDVRDFAAGQKVRDPRSGQMFLVPPK